MPSESSEIKFEIGHVLFIDIVGYSKLLISEQSEQLETLKKIVRGTEQVRAAEAEGKLLRLPTGDGGALVFRTSPEAPVLCALEVSEELKKHPELRVRMGIHSGPVNEIKDLNEQANVAGAGINIAQRVMDCGDAGHILLSKHVADDLEHYPQWRPLLVDLGECEVKHGTRLHLVNLYDGTAGNPVTPSRCALKKTVSEWLTDRFPPTKTRRALIATVMAAAILIVVATAFFFYPKQHSRTAGVPLKSIAILPLENLSGDPENAYFADGIQEEILARLAKIADLKVISRTSTQRYKSVPEDLPEIARKLGVAHVLEGSVQKAGEEVRVNVQLISAETDTHLWADSYDRKLTDIFQVESDIAKRITESLQAKLTPDEQHSLTSRPTENAEAHQLYLKGRYYWNQRSEEGLKKSIDYFRQAIDSDPVYALAYAGIADSYALLGSHSWGIMPPGDACPKAKAAAEKALEINPQLAEAHASLAYVQQNYDWDLIGSGKEFQRAIELNPNYPTAHQWYALHLAVKERYSEAIAEIKKAQQLDPLSRIINTNVAWVLYFGRQYSEMTVQCQNTVELDPNFAASHWIFGQAYRQQQRYSEAITEFKKAVDLSNGDQLQKAGLGHCYAVAGKRDEAQKVIDELVETSKRRYFPPYFIALIYVALNDNDKAFEWLEKAFAERSAGLMFLKAEPMFDPLRGDPRFDVLIERVFGKP